MGDRNEPAPDPAARWKMHNMQKVQPDESTFGAPWLAWFAVLALLGVAGVLVRPDVMGPGPFWVRAAFAAAGCVILYGMLPLNVWLWVRDRWGK